MTETPWPPIDLTMSQAIAAYWCVSWPTLIVFALTINYWPNRGMFTSSLAAHTLPILAQALFVPRLYRKKFRRFRIDIQRDADFVEQRLSPLEIARVSFRLIWPQLSLLATVISVGILFRGMIVEKSWLNILYSALRLFLVGPLSIKLAMQNGYPGFRLQAFGIRYV